jgi:hypothetical protein
VTAWVRFLCIVGIALVVLGCAPATLSPASSARGSVAIPSGQYSWGIDQRADDFADVEIAQSALLVSGGPSAWRSIVPTRYEAANLLSLERYYVMRARWKLKDGREFVLESVDIEAIMREYFSTHPPIRVQWEREGRPYELGDALPQLVHDVKGDSLRLRWVLRINRTPVQQRRSSPWAIEREVYPIAEIKGRQTTGLNFGGVH